MLKLSMMVKVLGTEDANITDWVAAQILQEWDYDKDALEFFRASANFIYFFTRQGKPYFLRFSPDNEREPELVQAEVNLLNWLTENGIEVVQPIPSRHNRLVETIRHGDEIFCAVVFETLPGVQLELEELELPQYQAWGKALGHLHAALKKYSRFATTPRQDWQAHLLAAKEYIAPHETALFTEWERLYTWAKALPVNQNNFGLIHFDFELDNLYWQDNQVSILDFDDCAYYWYVADIAFALRDLFPAEIDFSNPALREFITGYSQQTDLDEELFKELPNFLRLHKMLIYAKIARATDLSDSQVYPEWLTALNSKLYKRMSDYIKSL